MELIVLGIPGGKEFGEFLKSYSPEKRGRRPLRELEKKNVDQRGFPPWAEHTCSSRREGLGPVGDVSKKGEGRSKEKRHGKTETFGT